MYVSSFTFKIQIQMIYLIISLICTGIALLWVSGIDAMQEKHPNYNGEDLFDEEGF